MLQQLLDSINGILWSNIFVALALITGLYYTIRTRGAQFRLIKLMGKYTVEKNGTGVGRSAFQSFAVTLSGRVGTGNIAGVATAIFIGGPGAIFWMWLSSILGAATSIIESTLAQVYKVKDGNEYRGGTQYFIEKGLGMKKFAIAFAIASVFALGFCTPGIQGNAIADSLNNAFGFNKQIVGIVVAILIAFIITGGIKRISEFAEKVAPIMASIYLLVAVTLIIINIKEVPELFSIIISSAFGKNQIFGGIAGTAIIWGVKRGIYSNEAGNGTSTHATATAEVSHPVKSGLIQALSVYVDTLFVCTSTAFMALLTGQYNVDGIVENLAGVQAGPGYVQGAIDLYVPGWGSAFVAISMFFFALTTVTYNYYSSETGIFYLISKFKKANKKSLIIILRISTVVAIILFSSKESSLAWALGDVGVGIMGWLSFIALLMMGNVFMKVFKDFEEQYKSTGNAIFEPEKLGISNAEAWNDISKWKISVESESK
ncbi:MULTISPECIES: alanine/glycine:cation symporter family protein [unclassified Sedimentibacter]|uniref:alanine/glycine:cation symporter family protein n=1 Tax=unclassified Sedimentibacter TaxID=2649220 RepID=UPI0027E18D2D|nr:alanine/glycine:cation symporter family protein [Sedimentibacter sp. MB35-C1]WMJ77543.1 alanine/glycine:cation symporter family protein [Sedimentibacter sp. MB35-C1]